MKAYLTSLFVLAAISACAQNPHDQYSLEAGYGMGTSPDPGITDFGHFDVAFRYMLDESWGLKFDYGSDRFRTGDAPQLGSDYHRFSVQGVHNLGRSLNLRQNRSPFGLLAHGGLGYSSLKPLIGKRSDKIGNVILGLTPQYYLSRSFALMLDGSFILNVSQHQTFEGRPNSLLPNGSPREFTGKLFTVSFGITYYFGKNKSDSDWR